MIEPTATISLSEYEELKRIANHREQGLLEIKVGSWESSSRYFVPESTANERLKSELVQLQDKVTSLKRAIRDTDQRIRNLERFERYVLAPWWRRILMGRPE